MSWHSRDQQQEGFEPTHTLSGLVTSFVWVDQPRVPPVPFMELFSKHT